MSTKFKDTDGREWELAFNVNTLKRLKATVGVPIQDLFTNSEVREQFNDMLFVFDIIACVLEPQLAERDMTVEQLAETFDADTIEVSTNALLQAIVDSSPPAVRAPLQEAWTIANTGRIKIDE